MKNAIISTAAAFKFLIENKKKHAKFVIKLKRLYIFVNQNLINYV
jgi:hypothetical protein